MMLRHTAAIVHRELLSLFTSPIAYIILFTFLLVNGATFHYYLRVLDGELAAVIASQFGAPVFWFLCLVAPPLITMRAFAEERRAGTFELLISTGIGDPALIFGKFLGGWIFQAILWCALLPLFLLLDSVGQIDWGVIVSLYIGLLLIGALFTSIGVLASSLTQNQLVAAVLAFSVNLAIFFLSFLRYLFDRGTLENRFFEHVSPLHHFGRDFSQGVVDIQTLVLYFGVIAWALFLTAKVLERRRWS